MTEPPPFPPSLPPPPLPPARYRVSVLEGLGFGFLAALMVSIGYCALFLALLLQAPDFFRIWIVVLIIFVFATLMPILAGATLVTMAATAMLTWIVPIRRRWLALVLATGFMVAAVQSGLWLGGGLDAKDTSAASERTAEPDAAP